MSGYNNTSNVPIIAMSWLGKKTRSPKDKSPKSWSLNSEWPEVQSLDGQRSKVQKSEVQKSKDPQAQKSRWPGLENVTPATPLTSSLV